MTQTNLLAGKTGTQQLSSVSVQTLADKPQVFTVWSDEIERRIDPSFYIFQTQKFLDLTPINKFAKIQCGYAFKSSEYKSEAGVPLVRIQNIKDGEIDLSDTVYIDKKYLKTCKRFLLKDKDILIAMTGATIGKAGRINQKNLPAFLNQRVGRFIVNSKKINLDYLFCILQFDFFIHQINRLSLGGSQPNISPFSIEEVKIPLPPLSTQNKIVEIMRKAYQEKREKEMKANKLLESIDDYVLNQLGIKMPEIKREMVFEVMSDEVKDRIDGEYYQKFYKNFIGEVQKCKFPKKRLEDITEFIMNGRTPAKDDYVENENEGISLIKAGTASGRLVDLEKLGYVNKNFKGKQAAKKGDIFILSAAHQAEYVGKNVSFLDEEPARDIFFVGELINVRANPEICLSEYLFSFLASSFAFVLINREKRGQTSHLYPDDLKDLIVPVPPLAVQNKIVEKINSCYSQAQKLKDEANNNLQKAKEKVEQIILG